MWSGTFKGLHEVRSIFFLVLQSILTLPELPGFAEFSPPILVAMLSHSLTDPGHCPIVFMIVPLENLEFTGLTKSMFQEVDEAMAEEEGHKRKVGRLSCYFTSALT